MTMYVDRCKEKLKDYIENLEQLGANSRYYNNYEDYNKLYIQLKSIEYWAKKASKATKIITRNENYERGLKNEKEQKA